jgi:hypothetical protein
VPSVPAEREVKDYLRTLSNWRRWGADDELGTINLITPAKRVAAAALVSEGVSVSCARPIVTDIAADTTVQPMRFGVPPHHRPPPPQERHRLAHQPDRGVLTGSLIAGALLRQAPG